VDNFFGFVFGQPWLAARCPPSCSLSLCLHKGRETENTIEKLMDQNKDWEITYQLLSQTKETQLAGD